MAFKFIELFQEWVQKQPQKTAITCGKEDILSYQELDTLSARVYAYLKKNGVGKEDLVMFILPRSSKAFAAKRIIFKNRNTGFLRCKQNNTTCFRNTDTGRFIVRKIQLFHGNRIRLVMRQNRRNIIVDDLESSVKIFSGFCRHGTVLQCTVTIIFHFDHTVADNGIAGVNTENDHAFFPFLEKRAEKPIFPVVYHISRALNSNFAKKIMNTS